MSLSSAIRVFLSYGGNEQPPRMFITTLSEEQGQIAGNSQLPDSFANNGNTFDGMVFTLPLHDHIKSLQWYSLMEAKANSPSSIFDQLTLLRKKLWGELRHTRYALSALGLQRKNLREQYENEHWLRLIADLLRQAQSWKIRFDFQRLVDILKLAERNPRTAYDRLSATFQHQLAQRKTRLQRRLRTISGIRAISSSFFTLPYSVRNLASSQRSWFLRHGAHPSRFTPLQHSAVL